MNGRDKEADDVFICGCAVFSMSECDFQMNPGISLGAGKAMNEQPTKSLTRELKARRQ